MPEVRQSESPFVMAHKPSRAKLAESIAAQVVGLPAGHNVLTGRKAREFRAAYSEAYAQLAPQFPEDKVKVPPMCTCDWKPYPHRHSESEVQRFARCAPMWEVRRYA